MLFRQPGPNKPLARLFVVTLLSAWISGCGSSMRPFTPADPVWKDDDAHPFSETPEEYYSGLLWDGADQMIFRPMARVWAVDPGGEAENVNAVDEVPDSSWFINRLGRTPITPAAVERGACRTPPLSTDGPWVATGAKPNGANPGFIIKGNDGRGYLLKFDGDIQHVRATAADTIVSRLYHAAGFRVPCNRVYFFDRSIITIAPDAKSESSDGDKIPMTETDLDKVFAKAHQLPDGRYRGSASLFLDGKPLGPFRYEGTRSDDPNDVIPHNDRRELRGNRLMSAWVNHFDAREQNTLDMWVETGGGAGFIRHHIIDFGDCFGSIFEPPEMGRRLGHSSYLDIPDLFQDWLTLGLVQRPWEGKRFGVSKNVFGYYDVKSFVADEWEPGYPNPAMMRMTERDGAWMARILARFTHEHIRAAIAQGHIGSDFLEQELFRILEGRRQEILKRYLSRLAPLSRPRVSDDILCLDDLSRAADTVPSFSRRYEARAWAGDPLTPAPTSAAVTRGKFEVCVRLPRLQASEASPQYLVVDVFAIGGGTRRRPARVHLYDVGDRLRVVGLERPYENKEPSL
jgi:hypothetical protein